MVVSVVVCAYTTERWDLLQSAISSVEIQSVPSQIVLVIDHNEALLAMSRARWPGHTVVANRHRRGLSGARNTGVAETRHPFVAFLDDDAEAHAGWLAELVQPFTDEHVGAVGGKVEPRWSSPEPSWFPPEFRWVVGCSYEGLPVAAAEIRNPIGASMALRRSVLDRVGGFREEVGRVGNTPLGCEETELCIRARRLGFRVQYQPTSVISHVVTDDRATVRYFLRRCHAEGLSKAVVTQLAGTEEGLSSERRHLMRTLPLGLLTDLRRAVTGPRRAGSLGRALALTAGTLVTASGYLRGRLGVANVLPVIDVAATGSGT